MTQTQHPTPLLPRDASVRRRNSITFFAATAVLCLLFSAKAATAQQVNDVSLKESQPSDDAIEFFESRIRPVLVERCYECHNSAETAEADLAVDWRDGIRAATEHGTVVSPGNPEDSLLLKVIRHELTDLEMPEGGPKLDEAVVKDFEKWIAMGASDPRSEPPSSEELSQATSWQNVLKRRKQWWSLQPIRVSKAPSTYEITQTAGNHPVDRFVVSKLREAGLPPAKRADRRTLIRRLAYVLTGLPPSPDDINAYINDHSGRAFEKILNKYLSSQHFGERWARHWMDLFRYADSHGSEGDPQIPHAYQYRDYLIRAFNNDVPYDQLVREHLAGDLLEQPRTNTDLGINESAIGPAHFRFVFHGFAPTDALDEKVRFTDDQINVVSKAFLGMTVSCARCHDHKFDAISQTDYYAMFGIFGSCRPALRDINLPAKRDINKVSIREQKQHLKKLLVEAWLQAVEDLAERLLSPNEAMANAVEQAKDDKSLLHVWKRLAASDLKQDARQKEWQTLYERWSNVAQQSTKAQPNLHRWNLTRKSDYDTWFRDGAGLAETPSQTGSFVVNAAPSGDQPDHVVGGIFPAGIVTHELSQRHRAFLGSPRISLDKEYDAWLLVAGGGQPSLRYAVQNYPRDGTVYPIKTINSPTFRWEKLSLKYWTGDDIHFELATSKDAPLRNRNQEKSWFAIRDVVMRASGSKAPPNQDLEYLSPIFEITAEAPKNSAELAGRIQVALQNAIRDWRDESMTDSQAVLLNACLPLLPNSPAQLASANATIKRIRDLESEIPAPTRVPGVVEARAFDQPLFVRGNHRQPTEPVRRRFLEAIDPQPYTTTQSGRLELADSILHPNNPLTARVITNRIWHYLFGRGIVATPDNFGRLGSKPSHPQMLDYLAHRMVQNQWSIKEMIRFIVMSKTWQADSQATPQAQDLDPENALLSHANVNRLDAESIRDGLLAVSGELDGTMFGQGFGANSEGRRRSVYITSRRNSLDEFLKAFDSPTPFATTGRRDNTNVPSQSLMLMNDPLVLNLARGWAERHLESSDLSAGERTRQMIEVAFGRKPTADEVAALVGYVEATEAKIETRDKTRIELDREIEQTRTAIDAIETPARQEILQQADGKTELEGPTPIAAWDFEGSLEDSIGELDGKAYLGAHVDNGALILDGEGYVATGSLPQDLKAKTLEAWVQLDTLDQAGGGVVTVQTQDGVLFDSIVFAERRKRRWISGSNGFVRTDDLNSEDENLADKEAIHVAVTYNAKGEIRFYRNGQQYGRTIKKSGMQPFARQNSQIVFGMRHGRVGSDDKGRKLKGKVLAARVYGRALTDEEVKASSGGQRFVSDATLLASLSESQRNNLIELRAKLEDQLQKQSKLPPPSSPTEAWARLAHVLFNLKEFIYIR